MTPRHENLQDEIRITAEPTFDPQVCRFTVDRVLVADAGVRCADPSRAAGSPLFERLFAVNGVREVYALGPTLMVAKEGREGWSDLGSRIGAAIREALAAGGPLVDPALTRRTPDEEELRGRVQQLFDEEINPSLAGHGGFVRIANLRDGELYLTMGGGCQGCASAQMTLQQGIERAVRARIPEVRGIYDVTDHAAGRDPYHR